MEVEYVKAERLRNLVTTMMQRFFYCITTKAEKHCESNYGKITVYVLQIADAHISCSQRLLCTFRSTVWPDISCRTYKPAIYPFLDSSELADLQVFSASLPHLRLWQCQNVGLTWQINHFYFFSSLTSPLLDHRRCILRSVCQHQIPSPSPHARQYLNISS